MPRIVYDPSTVGGKLTAELVNDAIKLKAKAVRLMALVNANAAGGATPGLIETGGANAAMFGIATGAGAAYYSALRDSIYTPVNGLLDTAMASLDMGG